MSHHTITPARLTCQLLVQHLLSTLPIHIVPTTISQSGTPPPPAHTPPYPPTVGQSLVCQHMPPQWTADLEIISDATSSSYALCESPCTSMRCHFPATTTIWSLKGWSHLFFCACWTLFQWQPTYSHMLPSPPISSTPNIFHMWFKGPNSSLSCLKKGLFTNMNVLFRVQFRDGMGIVERTTQRSTLGVYGGKESGNGGRRVRKSAISDTQPCSTLCYCVLTAKLLPSQTRFADTQPHGTLCYRPLSAKLLPPNSLAEPGSRIPNPTTLWHSPRCWTTLSWPQIPHIHAHVLLTNTFALDGLKPLAILHITIWP